MVYRIRKLLGLVQVVVLVGRLVRGKLVLRDELSVVAACICRQNKIIRKIIYLIFHLIKLCLYYYILYLKMIILSTFKKWQ